MAKANMSVKATSKMMSAKDRKLRETVEDSLKGKPISRRAPRNLTAPQAKVYRWLLKQMDPSGMLSELDVKTLSNAAIIITRLEQIDDMINAKPENLYDRLLLSARKEYFAQYLQVCRELCLSPSARAKMGTLAVNKSKLETDPLLKILGGDKT